MQNIHIGPLPPPQNGISVYLYRLSKLDKKAQFINWNQISRSKNFRIWLFKQIFNFKKKNFIFHPPSIKKRLYIFFLSYISVHDFSLMIHGFPLIAQYKKSSIFYRFLIRTMLNRANFIQVVNPSHKRFINYLKIKNKNIFVKNAFLPPPLEDEGKIIHSYEKEMINFLEFKKPILIANAARVYLINNIDAYGLDMCIELTSLLKKDFPNIGFLFALADIEMHFDYFQKMKKRIKSLNIENNFYFMTGNKELWPIFRNADLMIRSTISDGDAISIREALYFNCSVLGSDVTRRPKGTYIFKNRDLKDLYNKCKTILDNKPKN